MFIVPCATLHSLTIKGNYHTEKCTTFGAVLDYSELSGFFSFFKKEIVILICKVRLPFYVFFSWNLGSILFYEAALKTWSQFLCLLYMRLSIYILYSSTLKFLWYITFSAGALLLKHSEVLWEFNQCRDYGDALACIPWKSQQNIPVAIMLYSDKILVG